MKNVKRDKAGSYDGVSWKFFEIGKGCCLGKYNNLCPDCKHKVDIVRQLVTPEYWSDPRSIIHMEARLVALNKEYPRIPQIDRYRPIVVMSHTIKFLEGFLVDKLKKYLNSKTSRNQFGFKKGIGIDELKVKVLEKLAQLRDKYKYKKQPTPEKLARILFIDFSSAFDSVQWRKLFQILE